MGSRTLSFLFRVSIAGVLAVVSGSAFAGVGGGVIVFAPDTLAVPALNGTMLAVLGLLMAVVAYRIFRSSDSNLGRMASVAVIVGGTILAGISGAESLRAIPDPPDSTIEPKPEQCAAGGSLNFSR